MDQSNSADSFGAPFEEIENRAEYRKKSAIHAFASDIENKYNVKCVIRDVSQSGCKIVTNCIDDLPDIIHLLPEAFETPILGKIVWREKNVAGVKFLSDLDDENLLINPVTGTRRNSQSSVIENEALRSCPPPSSFRDRFHFFAPQKTRNIHDSSVSEQQSKDHPVQDLISAIVHEFRTPLTALLGSLGLIQNGLGGAMQEKVASLVNVAHRNAEKLKLMVNDLLDLSKAESGKMQFDFHAIDIVELVRESINVNEPYAANYGVKISIDDRVGQTHIHADAARMEQVLTNLLSNAAKFSPDGETVYVVVDRHDEQIRVSVRDRGPGIPKEKQDQVFQKFMQIKSPDGREKHGTGLGLSICKSIVERHGGRLQLESTPGSGSTFFFELPEVENNNSEDQQLAAE